MALEVAAASTNGAKQMTMMTSAGNNEGEQMEEHKPNEETTLATSSRSARRSATTLLSASVSAPPAKRRCARFTCAVPNCSNDEKTEKNGRAMSFFDLPDFNDRRTRKQWLQVIPELEFAVSPLHRKVCEKHFTEGHPTDDEPVPALFLGTDIKTNLKKHDSNNANAKRQSHGEEDEGPPSLDTVLRQLAESANQADSSAEQPSLTKAKAQPTRILKVPYKTFQTMSSNGNLSRGVQVTTQKEGINTKTIQLPKGIVARPVNSITNASHATGRAETKPVKSLDRVISNLTREKESSPVTAPDTKPTLLSVLEGLKSEPPPPLTEIESPSTSTGPARISNQAGVTCYRCVNEMPVLRRSLGRLESRLDSMISMVKTLCSRQSGAPRVPPPVQNTSTTFRPAAAATNSLAIRAVSNNPTMKKVIRVASQTNNTPPLNALAAKLQKVNMSYLAKTISRTLLLFPAETFTMADFRAKGPVAVKNLNLKMLNGVLEKLMADGLLHQIDDHFPLTDDEAAFEKEKSLNKLSALTAYDIHVPTYLATFNKTPQ